MCFIYFDDIDKIYKTILINDLLFSKINVTNINSVL